MTPYLEDPDLTLYVEVRAAEFAGVTGVYDAGCPVWLATLERAAQRIDGPPTALGGFVVQEPSVESPGWRAALSVAGSIGWR